MLLVKPSVLYNARKLAFLFRRAPSTARTRETLNAWRALAANSAVCNCDVRYFLHQPCQRVASAASHEPGTPHEFHARGNVCGRFLLGLPGAAGTRRIFGDP